MLDHWKVMGIIEFARLVNERGLIKRLLMI